MLIRVVGGFLKKTTTAPQTARNSLRGGELLFHGTILPALRSSLEAISAHFTAWVGATLPYFVLKAQAKAQE